jgi:HD-GYP domain-containing protein (c-di-GMP phosphodiesterase class II)
LILFTGATQYRLVNIMKSSTAETRLVPILKRANEIASTSQLDGLLIQMLELIVTVCGGYSGTLYQLDRDSEELIFKIIMERGRSQNLVGQRFHANKGIAGATVLGKSPIYVKNLQRDPRWIRSFAELSDYEMQSMLSFPLLVRDEPVGVFQIFNPRHVEMDISQMLGSRMAAEIEKGLLLEASQKRSRRLTALVDIIGRISSSLDRDQILKMIVEYSCELLDAEVSSLFQVDEKTGEIVLSFATNMEKDQLAGVRVPPGKGVIGYVVNTGESVLVADTSSDQRFYSKVDEESGFKTHSILAVPLRTRPMALGSQRGQAHEKIIGGLEAINKRGGTFDWEDTQILETLAKQAATVLQIADLYASSNILFLDVISSLSAAIDAKDPFTEGHSQRVSEFSVAIAREMGLSSEVVHHIRIAGLLHDVGKIGIPDKILRKPGSLTVEEFAEVKKHPAIGQKILQNAHLLDLELAGIAEHHERVDGTGYPRELTGKEISIAGRIVAVADVFDAFTSDRPYRSAMAADWVLDYLTERIGTQFDGVCVEALKRAYTKGTARVDHGRRTVPIFHKEKVRIY